MTRLTTDDGTQIYYERFNSATVIDNEEVQISILKIDGTLKAGQTFDKEVQDAIDNGFPESGPLAPRTIEFLP